MRNIFLVAISTVMLIISGCAALKQPSPTPLVSKSTNQIFIKDDIKIRISDKFEYLSSTSYSKYYKYSEGMGGTTHDFTYDLFVNKENNDVIMIESNTLHSGWIRPKAKNVPKNGLASFKVGDVRLFNSYYSPDRTFSEYPELYDLVADIDVNNMYRNDLESEGVNFNVNNDKTLYSVFLIKVHSTSKLQDVVGFMHVVHG
ncbi:hypothetical protein [Vibrio fluvialis]|uniref:hypothetical protein n=1 Tax=Vibrio fluvialis TaxID=676 RepID=UPI001EEBC233|nr:hypothetical protein [Vibrio fluvialis]MCG6414369.1 hypothetical protein [Vibrio fluvialis]